MKYTAAQILSLTKSGKKRFSKSKISQSASEIGRKGGLVGGHARAAALTPKETMTIARHAAYLRWYEECPVPCPYCGNENNFFGP